ncbi:MAG: PEP-CTERM sorting domain-containing protein [Steroidobacteraceae bacterium]
MTRTLRLPLAVAALIATAPVFATPAPYTLTLTGVGDGANNGSVYYSPYVGNIKNAAGTIIYSGYLICDDYTDESYVNSAWGANETSAANLNGGELFAGETYTLGTHVYDTQQMYDAVSYLANELLEPTNVTNSANQGNLSFAIWDIMDSTAPTSDGSSGSAAVVTSDIDAAFTQVSDGYVGSNVEVYTPDPLHASQEFLVVNGPSVPEPSSLTLLALGLAAMGWVAVRRRGQRADG